MCWTQLSSIITIGTSIVIAGATWEIMKLNNSQAKVADQKQKDDLFKIRWDCYREIIAIIGYVEKHYNHYKHYETPIECDNTNAILESIRTRQKDAAAIQMTMYQNISDIEEVFTPNHDFISRVRWLFDDEIADIVRDLIISSIDDEANKINTYFEKKEINIYEYYSFNGSQKAKKTVLIPTSEFTKIFDKYLKLK
jgi:hypothetical protein